ncbi:reverse transcriptase domain-containing protein [Tanacetum coccineum]
MNIQLSRSYAWMILVLWSIARSTQVGYRMPSFVPKIHPGTTLSLSRFVIRPTGGNFLDKMPRDCLRIIESKSKVRNLRNKPVVAKVSSSSSNPGISPDVAELKDMVKALLLDKKSQAPTPVKAVEESCVTCGGAHSVVNLRAYLAPPLPSSGSSTQDGLLSKFRVNANTASSSGTGSLPINTVTNPKEDLKGITTQSGVAYQGPTIPTTSSSPKVVERETEPVVIFVSAPMPNLKPTIPYPSRRNDERRREKANDQIEKFYEIFKDLSFEISLTDALILMPKFASTLKALIGNKEKLSEMARTPLNEHCSAVILNKLPEKLGDPGKFLIPCDFPRMDECLALADLGASINLMPLSVWKRLSLPELTPTCMTLELADRSITQPIGIAEDVYVKVGKFHFLADFVVWLSHSLLCPIVSSYFYVSHSFGVCDFLLLEEADAFLALEDDSTSPEVDDSYYDSEGDILLLEAILNSDPSPPPPNQGNYLPDIQKELKVCEAKTDKSLIDEPPESELKDLPPHLEYAFLEGDDKLPVIIAKNLSVEEKAALIKVLKSRKRVIAWKLSDIKGINPEFYTHKILMEDDYKPAVQHQRRVNPKIHDVIKKEVEKLLDARLIYPISDSPWGGVYALTTAS